jgi:hypothetical protein
MGKIDVHSETHTKHTKKATLCGKMLSLVMLTVGGMYCYHWGLSGSYDFVRMNVTREYLERGGLKMKL